MPTQLWLVPSGPKKLVTGLPERIVLCEDQSMVDNYGIQKIKNSHSHILLPVSRVRLSFFIYTETELIDNIAWQWLTNEDAT
jgi:hypothetical protein